MFVVESRCRSTEYAFQASRDHGGGDGLSEAASHVLFRTRQIAVLTPIVATRIHLGRLARAKEAVVEDSRQARR